ncbi:MAG: hypothetical protein HW380_3880 [Magnetococcales bacterium]|nr:hypothetical protein [Magnetococcales bacterium]
MVHTHALEGGGQLFHGGCVGPPAAVAANGKTQHSVPLFFNGWFIAADKQCDLCRHGPTDGWGATLKKTVVSLFKYSGIDRLYEPVHSVVWPGKR